MDKSTENTFCTAIFNTLVANETAFIELITLLNTNTND